MLVKRDIFCFIMLINLIYFNNFFFRQIEDVQGEVDQFRINTLGQADSPKRPRPREQQLVHRDQDVSELQSLLNLIRFKAPIKLIKVCSLI